jgi:hypothetical protein
MIRLQAGNLAQMNLTVIYNHNIQAFQMLPLIIALEKVLLHFLKESNLIIGVKKSITNKVSHEGFLLKILHTGKG